MNEDKPLDEMSVEELLELRRQKSYGQAPAAPAPPPVQPAAVPSPEQQQVRQQAPITASEPPPRPVVHGKRGGLRDTLFKNGPAPIQGDVPAMSGVGEAEYQMQRAGNFAAGVASAPITMAKGMAGQARDALLDVAAASPYAEYPRPEEIAQPGPKMPNAPYNPSLEAAASAVKSGVEFGSMFSPVAPLVGGYGMLSGLKQATQGEDIAARGEGLGHVALASALARHSLAKGMPKLNQAGVESTPADLPAGLRTPDMDLLHSAAGKGVQALRAPLETLDAGLHAPGRFIRMVYDRATGTFQPEPLDAPDGIGAPPIRPIPVVPDDGAPAPYSRGVGVEQAPERMVEPGDMRHFRTKPARQPPPSPPQQPEPYYPVEEPEGAPVPYSGNVQPREYVPPAPEPRQYTPEEQAIRTSRLQGVPKPEVVRPQPSFVPREAQGVPEQVRRDRVRTPAEQPWYAEQPATAEAPAPAATPKRPAPVKQKPPVQAAPPEPQEPLMSGNTETGDWSAPESSTVNAGAKKRSLKKPQYSREIPIREQAKKDAQSGAQRATRIGDADFTPEESEIYNKAFDYHAKNRSSAPVRSEGPFPEAPAKPGAQPASDKTLHLWGQRAFQAFVKTGEVPKKFARLKGTQAFDQGWSSAESRAAQRK